MPGSVPVSVIVITCSAGADNALCLESVRDWGEIFVVDSFSTDDTMDLARSYNTNVFLHQFEGFATQRN